MRMPTRSTVTVYSWRRVRRPGSPAAGAWWAADVRVCITPDLGFKEPVTNVLSQFRVELPDGRALEPETDARRSDEEYARPGLAFVASQCRRGDVVFDVPTGHAAKDFAITLSVFGWPRWRLS